MKIITGLMRNVPKAEFSHNAAYARLWGKLLGAECEIGAPKYEAEETFLYIDINYSGGLNLFDGVSKDVYDRTKKLLEYTGSLFIIDHKMPDIGEVFRGRLNNASTYKEVTPEFCDALSKRCALIPTVKMMDFIRDELVIGDSHSIGMTPPGVPVIRLDAKTLHGALKDDFLLSMIPRGLKKLTLVFGSIDVRHHLLRQQDPYYSMRELYDNYFDKVKQLQRIVPEIVIVAPIPVETEERKMAATTKYLGEPFCGSRKSRLKMTYAIIEYMAFNAPCDVISYPLEWYSMDPQYFQDRIMERPRGIHLGWPYYRINEFGKGFVDRKFEKIDKRKARKNEEKN